MINPYILNCFSDKYMEFDLNDQGEIGKIGPYLYTLYDPSAPGISSTTDMLSVPFRPVHLFAVPTVHNKYIYYIRMNTFLHSFIDLSIT